MPQFDPKIGALDGSVGSSSLLVAGAVRDCLAPLKVPQVFEPVVEYVLHGTGPEVLATLRDVRADGADMVAKPDVTWSAERVTAVTDLHPDWTPKSALAARRTVYRAAAADVLARFGHVLHAAAGEAPAPGEPSWLLTLADDVARAGDVAREGGDPATESVRRRWSPDVLAEVARAGDAPGPTAVHAALSALLYEDSRNWPFRRHRILESGAGDAFLARYPDELADVVTGLAAGTRRYAVLRCARGLEPHVGLVTALAVDEVEPVRTEALAALSWLDGSRQVRLLRPHLRTAAPDRLPGVLARLADLDGGVEAIEEALTDGGAGPDDPARERLLRRTAARVRALRGPDAVVTVPPAAVPDDEGLLEELRTRPAASRFEGYHFWPGVQQHLARMPDVRALRDALRAAGMSDADRRITGLLITRRTASHRKIGAVLTAADAERWWPLFAERLDLVDEYLDGVDKKRDADDDAIDTTAMMLEILARFPTAPEALVPRLISIALGATRHRLPARRALGDHPGARAAATDALADTDADAMARSSAAEWLAELGEPGVARPEPGWEFGDSVLHPAVRALPASTLWWLDRFREQALDDGVPADDVNRWLGLARPTLRTAPDGAGPVVGRLGSPLMLPPDVPTPGASSTGSAEDYDDENQLIVTLDLSAIPPGAIDLPLPPDGHVLLFANADLEPWPSGGAVYVPAGTPVQEREVSPSYEPYEYDSPEDLDAELRRIGDLRLVPGVSLPFTAVDDETLAQHPHAKRLQDIWSEQSDGGGRWQVGGHAWDFDHFGDPVRGSAFPEIGEQHFSRPGDWVLLAQWSGFPMAMLYWTITRQDLEACRFDRVAVQMYANP